MAEAVAGVQLSAHDFSGISSQDLLDYAPSLAASSYPHVRINARFALTQHVRTPESFAH